MSFQCNACEKSYNAKSSLATHVRKVHLGITYKCTHCHLEFREKGKRNTHINHVHLKKPRISENVTCEECGKVYKTKQKLKEHFDAKHTDKTFQCTQDGCNFVAKSPNQLRHHMTSHEERFKCVHCGVRYTSNQNLKQHYASSQNDCSAPELPIPVCNMDNKRKAPTQLHPTNSAEEYLWSIRNEMKDHVTDDTPLTPEGIPKCYHPECMKVQPSYGELGGDKVSCPDHKKNNHVHLSAKRLCMMNGCTTSGKVLIRGCNGYHFCSPCTKKLITRGLDEEYVKFTECTRYCKMDGCHITSSFEDGMCKKHSVTQVSSDTRKCVMECCANGDGPRAAFFHPDHKMKESDFYKSRICGFARRALIEDALMCNDMIKVQKLLDHFGLDKIVTLNAQSAFRFACEKYYHESLKGCVDIVFDDTFKVVGRKECGKRRPDIFYKWTIDGKSFGIHIEYDENSDHEQDMGRLEQIAKDADCVGSVYVIRVRGGHGTKDPVCCRVVSPGKNYEYFRVTESGVRIARQVSELVKERIDWVKNGISPGTHKNECSVVVV